MFSTSSPPDLALSQGASEGNPLTNLFVHHLWLFILIKVGLPGLVSYRLWCDTRPRDPVLLAGMWWVVGVYSMVIILNALHLTRADGRPRPGTERELLRTRPHTRRPAKGEWGEP